METKINQIKQVFKDFDRDEDMETHEALDKIREILNTKWKLFINKESKSMP